MSRKRRLVTAVVAMGLAVLLAAGVASAANFDGNDNPNTIEGTDGADTIYGRGGADTLYGRGGIDKVYGGRGKDKIEGNADADTIYGGEDPDTIDGGDGIDYVEGDEGGDTIEGGADADRLNGDRGADTVRGGAGADTIRGGDDADTIKAGPLDEADVDTVYGETGNDTIDAANYPALVADNVSCGNGDENSAIVDPLDLVGDGCQNVETITERSGERVKGYFDKRGNPTHVEFDAYEDREEGGLLPDGHPYNRGISSIITLDDDRESGDEPRIRLKLTVNPETKNLKLRVTTPDSSATKLSDDDRQALNKAGNLLAEFLDIKNRDECNIKNQESLVARHFNLLADSPKNMELKDLEKTYREPQNRCGSNRNGSSTGVATTEPLAVGLPSIATGCPAHVYETDEPTRVRTSRLLERDGVAGARAQYVPLQSTGDDGIIILPCDSSTETAYFTDADEYPYEYTGYGPATGSPQGQCGPGYAGTIYTQDCLDHDLCNQTLDVSAFDPFFNDCSDEFQTAVDDFALGAGAFIGGYLGPDCDPGTAANYRGADESGSPTTREPVAYIEA